MRVLITGATGTLGRAMAAAVLPPGTVLRLLSRAAAPAAWVGGFEWASADLTDGRGLAAAVAGVDAIIHAASDPQRCDAVDVEGTRRLLAAADDAAVAHLLYVSVVGIDRIPHPYYRRKLVAEELVAAGRVPWSILRLTQFHPFLSALIGRAARVPLVIPLPKRFRFQSVDVSEAAARAMRAIADGPARKLPDFGGPEPLTLGEAAAVWRGVRGVRKPIVNLPLFGKRAAAFRTGAATVPSGQLGLVTFGEWLSAAGGRLRRHHARNFWYAELLPLRHGRDCGRLRILRGMLTRRTFLRLTGASGSRPSPARSFWRERRRAPRRRPAPQRLERHRARRHPDDGEPVVRPLPQLAAGRRRPPRHDLPGDRRQLLSQLPAGARLPGLRLQRSRPQLGGVPGPARLAASERWTASCSGRPRRPTTPA